MSRLWHSLAILLVILVFVLLCDARLIRPDTVFTIQENIQVAEAQAWWNGRLDLPERKWDSAVFDGKVYSHFPPLFSFQSAAVTPFFGGVPHWFVLVVVVLPVPVLAYLVMGVALTPAALTRGEGDEVSAGRGAAGWSVGGWHVAAWSVVLSIGLVCGTSALPVLEKALRGGGPYFVNQTLAMSGVLIFLHEYFGKQRLWIAAAGVVAAVWSRQLSVAYLLPFAWMAWQRSFAIPPSGFLPGDHQPPLAKEEAGLREAKAGARELKFAARLFLVSALALGVPMGLNWLKFGSPMESGYMYVYEGRTDDVFARDAREHGIFSTHYVPRNLYYMNLGLWSLHRIKRGDDREWHLAPQIWGTGIWWTTPLLLLVVTSLPAIIRDPQRRYLLIAAGLAYIGLMVYHSTGYKQRGFNRYSLDFVPVLFVLAVPAATGSRVRQTITVMLIGWSVVYFSYVRHWPQLRIG